jgi:spore germination protein KC
MKNFFLTCLVIFLSSLMVTGCWDKKEINDLAIVDAIELDIDPKTKERLIYFQVVNPAGVGGKSGESSKASVYTYKMNNIDMISGFSILSNRQIPRLVFTNDVQIYVLTQRYCDLYYREILEFIESNPTRRPTGYLLMTDAPIDTIMNTIVPLERVPGRAMHAMIELQHKMSWTYALIRARDAINTLSRKQPIVMPFISVMNSKTNPQFSKLEEINAPRKSILFNGGIVFIKDKVQGEIDNRKSNMNGLLNKKADRYLLKVTHDSGDIEVMVEEPKIIRKLSLDHGKSNLQLTIKGSLRILLDNRPKDSVLFNYKEIEQLINNKFKSECLQFVSYSREKNWDLLGIQDQIDRRHSKAWSSYKSDSSAWMHTNVNIITDLKVKWIGWTKSSYAGEENS